MRIDMAKVVTERPRRGHGNPSKKWGRRLGKNEHDAEDHGPTRAPIARRHQYGWNAKEFSDLLGPLRRYLRKQVGRPWNKVWSEIVRNLDSRSLSGQHIFDHIRWEVAQHVSLGPDGSLHRIRWSGAQSAVCTFIRLQDCFATGASPGADIAAAGSSRHKLRFAHSASTSRAQRRFDASA